MKLTARLVALAITLLAPAYLNAAIFVKIPGVPGDAKATGYDDGTWFVADSFSFGVEREMKESGEKGGTEDINIGVGELQECTISKAWDRASTRLLQYSFNGNSAGTAEIHFTQSDPESGAQRVYLIVKLDRCFVKSWSTSGDADDRPTEEVAFYYNKIAVQFYHSEDGRIFTNGGNANWDKVKNTPWSAHGLPDKPPK